MRDSVSFLVNNKPVVPLTYTADSDLWLAADAFSFTVFDPSREMAAGQKVEMRVNKEPAMVGVVDKVESKTTKKGEAVTVSGRDLMGLLCDHNVTEYQADDDLSGASLKAVAESVMRDIPFLDMKDVIYEGRAARLSVAYEKYAVSPGQTAFDVLKPIAQGRGLHFWCREDGKFVFGVPVSSGAPAYHFILEKTTGRTNVLEASKTTDISQGFSKIIVHSQSQDTIGDEVAATETMAVPAEFPFYKPKVVNINGDSRSPYYEARRLINLSKAKSLQLQYLMPGHSQGTRNYTTNVMARVDDEPHDIHGNFIVSGRTFTLTNKKTGPQTLVRLCRPGIIIDA